MYINHAVISRVHQPHHRSNTLCCKQDGVTSLLCVATGDLKKDDIWTQSRQNLEEAIEEEKENTSHKWDPDLLSHEQRLEQRLDKLNLDMYIMGSDGACQVWFDAPRHSSAQALHSV